MSDLKTRTRIGNTVDNKLLEQFRDLSDKTRISMSKLLDEAIKDLLNKYSHSKSDNNKSK
ncbi:ribbon-helix-helix domain-containing protein [Neobacillus pocheonensis]|uniref:ribbon-helix-helix domain-containing protein n=1 Tax=Neobacillus pocheonensis TaxID=363869 RepID=UPI003D269275